MRVTSLYNKEQPIISMEFFPPRNEASSEKFDNVVDTLKDFSPHYMTVTFGAGGSTRQGSYETVKKLIEEKKVATVAYIAGYGLGPDKIRQILDEYEKLKVETIFVIRGDKPDGKNFTVDPQSFSYASDLIAFIKKHYNFTLGCAGYPEGHIESKSLEQDIKYLKLKTESGADYVVCQYCYDNKYFFHFLEQCSKAGINVPIIPGIMPIYTIKMTKILSKICGTTITKELQNLIDNVDQNNKKTVLDLGVSFAIKQCEELLNNGVKGLHFYTMNRSESVVKIIKKLYRNIK